MLTLLHVCMTHSGGVTLMHGMKLHQEAHRGDGEVKLTHDFAAGDFQFLLATMSFLLATMS